MGTYIPASVFHAFSTRHRAPASSPPAHAHVNGKLKNAFNSPSLDTPFPQNCGKAVLDRQKERGDKGDNVPYEVARTVRSGLLYQAAYGIGCRGGNQCGRGLWFARAINMFAGKNMEGIPRDVVLAFLRQ